ncbi:MAG: type II toxin-antitoxin system VapC family toxin, partial [Bacillota bacterium]|nr:type II toxin-antitoxin system VapC family toxin [Bacillota bacterium]
QLKREAWLVDTNVIMYARGKDHPYKAACARILLEIAEGFFAREHGVPVVDTEVFQEILYRYGMEQKWETAVAVCQDLLAIGLKVLAVGRPEVETMIDLAEKYGRKGVRPRDLVHAAVMVRNGIRRIITADTHFDPIEEVERIDPLSFPVKG